MRAAWIESSRSSLADAAAAFDVVAVTIAFCIVCDATATGDVLLKIGCCVRIVVFCGLGGVVIDSTVFGVPTDMIG